MNTNITTRFPREGETWVHKTTGKAVGIDHSTKGRINGVCTLDFLRNHAPRTLKEQSR